MSNHFVLEKLLKQYESNPILQGTQSYSAEQKKYIQEHFLFLQKFGNESQFRANHQGHFTASVFIADLNNKKCLLLWHEKLQKWLQPGGHIEPEDADVCAAALREGYEESGALQLSFHFSTVDKVTINIFDIDTHRIPECKTEPEHTHYDIRFLCIADSTIPLAAQGVKWIDFDAVDKLTTEASILRVVNKASRIQIFSP